MPNPNAFFPQPMSQFSLYQPQGYMTAGTSPMLVQQQQQQPPIHGFVYVTGLDGAKAYQMPPNSEMPLFDSAGDIMYIKTTDGAGFPTIKVCNVKETQSAQAAASEYVTRDELDRTYRDLTQQLEQMKGAIYGAVPATSDAAESTGQHLRPSTGDTSGDGR